MGQMKRKKKQALMFGTEHGALKNLKCGSIKRDEMLTA